MEKTDSPRVSVVIVNFNAGDRLLDCVASVLASSLPVEVILVDNASSDGSLEAVEQRFACVHTIRNTANTGFSHAVNQGLEQARGTELLVLNPDCELQPDTLQRLFDALSAVTRWGMAGCRILDADGREQRGCRRNLPTLAGGLRKALGQRFQSGAVDLHCQPLPDGPIEVEAISGAFMLVRRQAMEAVGGLDEGYFLHCEDLDWCKRFNDAGWPVIFVPQVEIIHHQGRCSASTPLRVEWHKHQGMWRYYRKFLAAGRSVPTHFLVRTAIWGRFLLKSASLMVKRLRVQS